MKKMDNLSVITGSVDKITKDFDKYDREIAIAQISALSSSQVRGSGYQYSGNLVRDLMSPHSLKQIDQRQLFAKKNKQLYGFQSQQTFDELAENEYQSTHAHNQMSSQHLKNEINFSSMPNILQISTLQ